MGEEWPFVGRSEDLRLLREMVVRPTTAGVVLAGKPGLGKTRLALEALRFAAERGLATVQIRATHTAAAIPFGAVGHLLPETSPADAGGAGDRKNLVRHAAAALLARAGEGHLVVLVDDGHLLDDTSATLLHQLALSGRAFLLVTLRTGEAAPDSVVSLWKNGLLDRLEVTRLSADAVEELLVSVLAGPVDHAAVAELMGRSQGNVLFLRELVLGALGEGVLRREAGIWRLAGRLAPSDRLVELVETRLDSLSADERALLEVVSLGEPLGAAELEALADPALAERLERKSLLVSTMEERRLVVQMAHPVYGDVLRARLPQLRARAIARSLAEVVQATGARRREDLLRVARWHLDGGDRGDPELLLAAALAARWHYDFDLAERLVEAALRAGAGFDAAVLAAQLAGLQGRLDEAEVKLAALAAGAATDEQRAVVLFSRLDHYVHYASDLDQGLTIIDEAEAVVTDPDWRQEIGARRCALLLGGRGPAEALEAAQALRQEASGTAAVWACLVAAHSFGRLGSLDAALEAAAQGETAHRVLDRPSDWYPWTFEWLRCEALAHAGHLFEARDRALRHYEQGVQEGSDEAQAWFAMHLSRFVAERGDVLDATHYAHEAVALFRQLGRPAFAQFSLGQLAVALAVSGRDQEAAETLRELDELDLPPQCYDPLSEARGRAWAAVAGGQFARGRDILTAVADTCERIGDRVSAAAALHDLARVGYAGQVTTRLAELAGCVQGELIPARAAHAEALAAKRPAALDDVSYIFQRLGAFLPAAEAAADAAVAWRRAGNPDKATSSAFRAGELARLCQGASTPSLRAVEARAQLTPAERETAVLAAAGRSNREIANELSVSVRTIESRLYNIYAKLGISGRSELTRVLEAPVIQSQRHEQPTGNERAPSPQ